MELKPNMYVRTKSGLIAKFIGYEKNKDNDEFNKYNFNGRIYWYYEYYNNYVYEEDFEEWFKESVIKVSRNITDLIEVGDYVNGLPVRYVEEDRVDIGQAEDFIWLKNQHIKSIVTKEQMEAMEYKL